MAKKTKKKTPKRSPVRKRFPTKKIPAKKKAPPKKKAPSKKKAKKKAKKIVKISVGVDVSKSLMIRAEDNVRMFARLYYAVNTVSIAEMIKNPIFSVVSLKCLENWSMQDSWVSARKEFQEKMRKKVQNVMAGEIVLERSNQLKEMVDIRNKVHNRLMVQLAQMPDEDNLPALINAYVRLMDMSDRFVDKLSDVFIPALVEDDEDGILRPVAKVKPNLTPEEARAAAKLLLQMRRDATRKDRDGDATGSKKPALRVVTDK